MTTDYRIGLIVPSSNVTVEAEMPALLSRHEQARFSFHASRMRMNTVSPEGLRAMNAQAHRCTEELLDAEVDALLYGCLVAIMAQGSGEHVRAEAAIERHARSLGWGGKVLSSAGALIGALHALGSRRVAVVTPYVEPLARQVVAYLESEDLQVVGWAALEVADNCGVARIDGGRVLSAARDLDLSHADALVLSACVQMPSLPLIAEAEREFGIPVLSAATAGAFGILRALDLQPVLPDAGTLLAGTAVAASAHWRHAHAARG